MTEDETPIEFDASEDGQSDSRNVRIARRGGDDEDEDEEGDEDPDDDGK